MKPLPVDVLATAMNASVNAALEVTGIQATGFAIDSRHITPGDVFCALEGERVDGHDFAAEAIAAGAVAIITNRDIADVPCLVTDNSLEALGRLAHWYRTHELSATVIAVTGSSGKTTTKDLIADVLPGAVVAARGSFNTEVGVPLTILEADPSTDYLVLEMGMRGIGHIAYLAEMAEPDIGVVLNVGLAHVGMMNGPEEIARAKSELVRALSADGVAVLNCDDFAVSAMAEQSDAPVVWFGESKSAGVRATGVQLDNQGRASFDLTVPGEDSVAVHLLLHGEHFVSVALAAAAVGVSCGMSGKDIARELSSAQARSRWRMDVQTSTRGITVINDAYNANPDSVRAALKTLRAMQGSGRTWAVLGEMLELGDRSTDEHDAIGRLAVRLDISRLVCVGIGTKVMHLAASNEGSWGDESVWVEDPQAAIDLLDEQLESGDVVLVKASRAVGMERVPEHLLNSGSTTQGSDQ